MKQRLTKKPVLNWLFLLLITFALVNCESNTPNSNKARNEKIKLITLSPHLAELVVSAGALDNLVGVVAYSDFPMEVRKIDKVGDAFKLDYETIVSLKPDYVLTWKGGTSLALLNKLKHLNIKTVEISINKLSDIPKTINQIAQLTHTHKEAQLAIDEFNNTLENLKLQQHNKLATFIETYHQPLYTVSSQHWMSQAASVCGFNNIFTNLSTSSATVTLESVIIKNPQAIITVAKQKDNQWQKWSKLDAVKDNKIILIDPDIFSRPSMRLLQGIKQLCKSN